MATRKPAASKSTAVATTTAKKAGAVATMSKADIQARLKEELAKQKAKTQESTGKTLSITTKKKFVAPDGSETDTREVIVLDFLTANLFYDRIFDPKNPTPPACFAISITPEGGIPSDKSPVVQADDCASCPQNQWESGPRGTGKACKNTRRVAVIFPEDLEKGEDAIMIMTVAPTSLRAFDGYVNKLAREEVLPCMVTTNLSLDPDSEYPKLIVDLGEQLSEDDISLAFGLRERAMEMLQVEPDVSGYEPVKAKASPRARR